MTITAKRLEKLGACQDQVDAFRAIWGDGPAPMTVEAAVEAALEHAQVFKWDWAAYQILSDAAWAEYDHATASAWAEYKRARAAVFAEYNRACARAFAEAYIKQEDAK